MRYDAEKNEIKITARELVSIARRGVGATPPRDENEPIYALSSKTSLSYPFEVSGYKFELEAEIADITEEGISLTVPTDSSPKRPRKEITEQARGEGYIAAFIYSELYKKDGVRIDYTYKNERTGEENEVFEIVKRKKLENFFDKCTMSIKVYAKPEIERVTERIPSMKKVKFPYGKMREGQREIIQTVYKNVARGGTLFTAAPTGTGKTVSMLYPAIRAMGDERCDKVFYLTPKTTIANAAKDCIEMLVKGGARIKAIILPSKERACISDTVCRISHKLCENAPSKKLADATIALYQSGVTTVTAKELKEVGKEYKVCPHELGLTYAELCDVVICDINYLFDPRVYIRRFFTVGGRYSFLIDEAHNLPDRAREMYSAEIKSSTLISLAQNELINELSPIKNATRVATDSFREILMPFVKEELYENEDGVRSGAAHVNEVPVELYDLFDGLLNVCEDEIFKNMASVDEEKDARANALREYYYTVKRFRDTMEVFDTRYEFFVFLESDEFTAKCFCIDPSGEISKRLEQGHSATFFSGTLSPMYYYRATLGGDGTSEMMEVDSPFDESQLSVTIMDKISTRLSEREDTLGAVCRVIAATVSARRGNYMIFSPSFKYSAALAKAFAAKYPKIRILEQKKDMTAKERADFLLEFEKESPSYLIGFCVMGGIYSEGIDLVGESLIGAVVIGIGIPALSYEREAIAAYYNDKYEEGKQFAYIYPGVNRVLQAAGRVIRREDDRGVIVLIDDRFDDPIYKTVIPKLWSGMKYISAPKELREELDRFWAEGDANSKRSDG